LDSYIQIRLVIHVSSVARYVVAMCLQYQLWKHHLH
jgi:hypothetical protein